MSNLDLLKETELEILPKFADICEKEDLTWYAMFGTLLGATRHGGFIPWDDDIDVAMPRADYDRLRGMSGLFEYPYFLQTTQNDPAGAPRFMRLRRSDTTVITKIPFGFTKGGNMGAYIDILPLDDVHDIYAARKLSVSAKLIQAQLLACAALDENKGTKLPRWKALACYSAAGLTGAYKLVAEHYEMVMSEYKEAPYYAIPVLTQERGSVIYDKNWFSSKQKIKFENIEVYVPSGFSEVLVASFPYGLLEPVTEKKTPNHITDETIIDMQKPYTEYVKRYTDMLENITGKDVILFGAADSLRIWMERYSKVAAAKYVVDNSESKWGTTVCGLEVRPPHELQLLLHENCRLIITSIYHEEIGKQLTKMGIDDYYVFIDGWSYGI